MKKSYLLILIFSFVTFLLIGCGHQKNPTGGKKDTVKPEILAIQPEEFSDISEQKIEVTFSKPIERTTILRGLQIYPIIQNKKFKWDDTTLIIQIREKLQKNTNYFFFFTNLIKGEHGNELAEDQLFIFKNGSLQKNKISGNFSFEKETDAKNPILMKVMTIDSTKIFHKKFTTPTYDLKNLNAEDHILESYIDLNKNGKYDYEKEPYSHDYVPAQKFTNLDIEIAYEDTVKPKIKNLKALSSKQLELSFSELIKDFEQIKIFSDDSLQKEIPILDNALLDDKINLICSELDSIKYKLEIFSLCDLKNNSTDLEAIFDGNAKQDTIPPEVIFSSLQNGSTIAELQPEIELRFSELLPLDSLTTELREVESGKKFDLEVKKNEFGSYFFSPKRKLKNTYSYRFEISYSDFSGNQAQEKFVLQFIPIFHH